MLKLSLSPQVFVVKTTAGSNDCTWNLLTLDGSDPNETVYFFHKDDAPSDAQSSQIAQAVEDENWEETYFIESSDILDYSIDKSIFETAGEAYSEINDELAQLLR
ncbi:hypothetical protein [Emticicia sp. BO119]|uniref:hypothetical protein n=1 Tax=Emticicia sp. BO119 TaxID=2757768 RepID=UPI0015F028A7|nr:hypothetical protein [Emticicia sp. BO119]MBA4852083.1 hypothetical protein [Emticicia sp. BO119]